MAADPQNTIQQYVSFEFFDSLGNVPTEFGAILYFSNVEILSLIKEGEKVGTEVLKTRSGRAAGSFNALPRSYEFEISCRAERQTWGKIRRLIEAIEANYRIKFRIYSGYLLWDEAFQTFADYAPNASTTFDTAIVDIGGDPSYRSIQRGYGLATTTFSLTVYEGLSLPVPNVNNQIAGGNIVQEVRNIGGINISFGVFDTN